MHPPWPINERKNEEGSRIEIGVGVTRGKTKIKPKRHRSLGMHALGVHTGRSTRCKTRRFVKLGGRRRMDDVFSSPLPFPRAKLNVEDNKQGGEEREGGSKVVEVNCGH